MSNLTKLYQIQELINCPTNLPTEEREELNEYIQELIAIASGYQSSKLFTAEEVVNELKENETLDDAISFFTSVEDMQLALDSLFIEELLLTRKTCATQEKRAQKT